MKYDVINLENQKVESIDLSDAIFGVEVRSDILSRVVNWQLAKRRAGTHSVKNLSTISGTTKKPFRQKGTGRGRQGTLRAPEFRHGAVAFGPVVRSHEHDLNKKIRKLGLKCALSAKVKDGKLFILDAAKAATPKTKELKLSQSGGKISWLSKTERPMSARHPARTAFAPFEISVGVVLSGIGAPVFIRMLLRSKVV